MENTKTENLFLDLITMNKISLLILAGGLGSRYQGQKQVDKITEFESLMEFALFDALKVGIQKFVFIINDQFPVDYKNHLKTILENKNAEVHFVVQNRFENVPEDFHQKLKERIKPLGTAHAVLCAKKIIQEPFITMNADDFYGRNSFQLAFDFASNSPLDEFGIVGFQLENTLSENGKVSRGICQIQNDQLKSVSEHIEIEVNNQFITGNNEDLQEVILDKSDIVSMNLWVLNPLFFDFAETELIRFLENSTQPMKDEFYLPSVIDSAIQSNQISVKVLYSKEKWMGLTYAADKLEVSNQIQQLISQNVYPNRLWN